MRAAGTGDEHAKLTGLTRTKGLTESLGGLGIILRQEVAGAFVGLALPLLAGLRSGLVLTTRRVRRTADLDGDSHGSRSDLGVGGTQDELVDDLVAFYRDPQCADLAAFAGQELPRRFGLRDVARAVVVGEVDASVEDLLLHLAAEEMHFGDHGDGVVRAPAADGSQEVDAIGDGADGDLDLLGEALGIDSFAVTALKDDDVQAVLGALGVDDLVRDAVGFDFAELGERQGVTLGFLVGVETGVRRGGERCAEIEQTEAADGLAFGRDGHAAEVRDHVTEAFGSQRFEAFGHQGVRTALTTGDVGYLELGGLARGQLELHEGRVLAADQGRVLRAIFHLEVPGAMLVVHHAVRIHDVHQHLCGRMRADALEVRPEVVAEVADLVAGLAGRDEQFLALDGVAGLLDLGTELRDEVILGRTAAGVELGKDRGGALGDGFVRITHELRDLHGSELHRGERLGFQGVKHQAGPFGSANQRGEQGGAIGAGRLREGGVKELADGSVAARRERTGGGDGDSFVRTSEGLDERRANLGVRIAKHDEHAGGGDLCLNRGLGVGEHGYQSVGDQGQFSLQASIGEPKRRNRGGRSGDSLIRAGEQCAQGGTGSVERGRSRHTSGSNLANDGDRDRLVRGLGRGGQHEGSIVAIQRSGERPGEISASGISRTREDPRKDGTGIGGGGGGGGGLGPIIGHPSLGGQEQRTGGGFEGSGAHGA